jgi:hypothetical protein
LLLARRELINQLDWEFRAVVEYRDGKDVEERIIRTGAALTVVEG